MTEEKRIVMYSYILNMIKNEQNRFGGSNFKLYYKSRNASGKLCDATLSANEMISYITKLLEVLNA